MIDSVTLISSEERPMYFVRALRSENQDAWQIDSPIPDIVWGDVRSLHSVPSSSCSDFENLSRKWLRSPKLTSSNISFSELFSDAGPRFGESRENSQECAAKIFILLSYASVGYTELGAATPSEQRIPGELSSSRSIQSFNYENLMKFLICGLSKFDSWHDTADIASWSGEFQPMLMHADADGTEITEPLPDEPAPMSRKRQIRRTVGAHSLINEGLSNVDLDAPLGNWRQGDFTFDAGGFLYASPAEGDEHFDAAETTKKIVGLVAISQTCDIVQRTGGRHFVAVCPLVKVFRLLLSLQKLNPNGNIYSEKNQYNCRNI